MTDSFAFSRAGWLRGSAAALAGLSLDLGGAPRIAEFVRWIDRE